jgi:hypothetical protein
LSRTIKFRVYDKENKRMLYSSEPRDQGEREYIPFQFGVGWSDWEKSWLSDLMQFTGLKDKQGKEVYEGDIIKAVLEDSGELKDVVEQVYYTEEYAAFGPFCHLMHYDEGRWIDCLQNDEFEVIGNIYEHPELLKGKKL